MLGKLYRTTNGVEEKWYVRHEDNDVVADYQVNPNAINHLQKKGFVFNVDDEVEFTVTQVYEFPYQWAVIVEKEPSGEIIVPPVEKKYKTKTKITLWLSGFQERSVQIVCDEWNTSSSGYYYFYNESETGRRKYLGNYPIERTIVHKIEEIQVEI